MNQNKEWSANYVGIAGPTLPLISAESGIAIVKLEDLEKFVKEIKAKTQQDTEREILIKIENWAYLHTNYVTMMQTQKSKQKGELTKELVEELLSCLTYSNLKSGDKNK